MYRYQKYATVCRLSCATITKIRGEATKALEAADKLPSMYHGSELIKMNILKGEDLVRMTQWNIRHLMNVFCRCLQRLADMDGQNDTGYTWEQKIEIYRKAIAMFDIVFDKGDYNDCFHNLSFLHRDISIMAMRAGDFGLALEISKRRRSTLRRWTVCPT